MKNLMCVCLFQLILISSALGQEKKEILIGQQEINLAGTWSFRMDSLNSGVQEQWFDKPAQFFDQKIKLPGTTDDAGFGNPLKLKLSLKEV